MKVFVQAKNESVVINDEIIVTVLDVNDDHVILAIDAPEWHTDHLISSFYPRQVVLRSLAVEERFGDAAIADLRRRGHDVTVEAPWSLGRVSAVQRDDGQIRAAANARGMQGYAIAR